MEINLNALQIPPVQEVPGACYEDGWHVLDADLVEAWSYEYASRIFEVRVLVEGKPVERHLFRIPSVSERGGGFYRQTTSFSAFNTRETNRFCDHNSITLPDGSVAIKLKIALAIYAQCRLIQDRRRDHHHEQKFPQCCDYLEAPTFFHPSVWDMYIAIGYDYKSKKWIRNKGEQV